MQRRLNLRRIHMAEAKDLVLKLGRLPARSFKTNTNATAMTKKHVYESLSWKSHVKVHGSINRTDNLKTPKKCPPGKLLRDVKFEIQQQSAISVRKIRS